MASRNFHKRRTKERKARQRIENRGAEERALLNGLRRFRSMPISLDHTGYGAALAAFAASKPGW